MFAQLGNTEFVNRFGFSNFSQSGEAVLVEHGLIDGKPKLQPTGNTLQEIQMSISLHSSFCNVNEQIRSLRKSMDSFEVLPLLWGTGELEGEYLILSMATTIDDADKDGFPMHATIDLTLKEHVVRDRLQQEQAEARKKALAVGNKKNIAVVTKTNKATCNQQVSKLVSNLESYARVIENTTLAYSGTPEQIAILKSNLKSTRVVASKLKAMAADSASCAFSKPLENYSMLVDSEGGFFLTELTHPTKAGVLNENRELQYRVKNVKREAAPIIKASITRK